MLFSYAHYINYIKANFYYTKNNNRFKFRGDRGETLNFMIRECRKLAHKNILDMVQTLMS